MPALVVWERLNAGGDDLRVVTMLALAMRILQIVMVSFIVHQIVLFEHKPDLFIISGCLHHEDSYWLWYDLMVSACCFTLVFGIIGAMIEVAMCRVSGWGTPTETEARSRLVPLCKCNMVPMLIIRTIGFVFSVTALLLSEKYCNCVYDNLPEEFRDPRWTNDRRSTCPTDVRSWYIAARILIFTMACDAFFPAITLLVVMRHKIHKCYRHINPPKERSLDEVQKSWRMACKRCCECSSLFTCYLCGGQKLTANSYADVAIALSEFLGDEGQLDIVPSDIAVALICLTTVQKQKKIDAKNELMNSPTIFAKDRKFANRLWRQLMGNNKTNIGSVGIKRRESWSDISGALKTSVKHMSSTSSEKAGDVESGLFTIVDSGQSSEEEKVEIVDMGENAVMVRRQSTSTSLTDPTDIELEEMRQMILKRKDTMNRLDFSLVCMNGEMGFMPTITRVLSQSDPFDCLVLGEGSRYCAVALASYSWMMYMWTNKCTGCASLMAGSLYRDATCNSRCCCCYSSDKIIGGDTCGWKVASVMKSLGISESDMLYANFSNDVGVNPYMILRDLEWKTIIITIRGTLSFEDMVSDVTISPMPLDKLGEQFGFDGKDEYCHSGMFAGAKWIESDLTKHGILDKAMEAHPDFGLRIIGHSLGAGVAAVLGRILKQQYPDLHCLCFSPPGCVFSERTARESRKYAVSYVLHDDIVPRLSYEALVRLRNELIEMVARIKVPKHEVFDANWWHWNEEALLNLPDKFLHDEIPSSKFYTEFQAFKARQSQRQEGRVNMTIPGRIVHMVRTSEKMKNVPCDCLLKCCKCVICCGLNPTTTKYKVRWTEVEDLSGILISPTMLSDHFPYNVARALDVAAESYGLTDEDQNTTSRVELENILEGAKKES